MGELESAPGAEVPRWQSRMGWIAICYFMIGGGFTLGIVIAQGLGLIGDWVGNAILFVGAASGGWLAGRVSRRRTVVEPAVAAVLLVLSVMLFGILMAMVFAVALLRINSFAVTMLMIIAPCAASGWVAQRLAPRPIFAAAGAGCAGCMAVIAMILVANVGTMPGGVVVVCVVFAGIGTLFGWVGARLAWHWAANEAPAPPVDIPEARVR